MDSRTSNLDIKSDHIEEYVRFMSSSLAPSSIRLLKIDIAKFYSWYVARSDENKGDHLLEILDSYKSIHLKSESGVVAKRKLSSILRFINWIEAQSPPLVNNCKTTAVQQINSSNIQMLSLKYKIAFLFTILFLAFIFLYFLKNPATRDNSSITDDLKRFVIYIPVVSDALPPSLERAEYKLKIYAGETSITPVVTLLCDAKVAFFNSKPHVSIDSSLGCKQLTHTASESMSALPAYFIDIVVRTTKINSRRIIIKPNQAEIYANGNMQGQNIPKTIVGRQGDSLIDSLDNLKTKIATDEASIDTRPNSTVYMPLSVFEIFDATNGDVVTISLNRLSRSILNSPVVGVIEGTKLVMSGKTLVNVSEKSEAINAGDYVSVSLEPGRVIKASLGYENVIGVALDSWPNENNTVTTLLIK